MSEAKQFVKDFIGVNEEEFNKLSNDELLKKVQDKLHQKLEENPNEMVTIYHPNKLLREKCEPVTTFHEAYKTFARHLLIHCRRQGGLGMAGPQVGFLHRIIVVDTHLLDHIYKQEYVKKDYPYQLFNPEIINPSGKIRYKEGCLSCPGAFGWVERYTSFTLKYQEDDGKVKQLDITCDVGNPYGIVIQHEIDHLDGIEFIDKLNFIDKDKALKAMNKYREKK